MRYGGKWTPSKTKRKQFAEQMKKIEDFCLEKGITSSANNDSYYFSIEGQRYRVSNHSIESSNQRAFRDGVQIREKYHSDDRHEHIIYIHASKTRIIEIYEKLESGMQLDGRGNEI